MVTATLRVVGGSVMMAIPKPLLESLKLGANSKVALAIEDGRLVVMPQRKPRYSLDELLSQCDADAAMDRESRQWLDDGPVGDEAI